MNVSTVRTRHEQGPVDPAPCPHINITSVQGNVLIEINLFGFISGTWSPTVEKSGEKLGPYASWPQVGQVERIGFRVWIKQSFS